MENEVKVNESAVSYMYSGSARDIISSRKVKLYLYQLAVERNVSPLVEKTENLML